MTFDPGWGRCFDLRPWADGGVMTFDPEPGGGVVTFDLGGGVMTFDL